MFQLFLALPPRCRVPSTGVLLPLPGAWAPSARVRALAEVLAATHLGVASCHPGCALYGRLCVSCRRPQQLERSRWGGRWWGGRKRIHHGRRRRGPCQGGGSASPSDRRANDVGVPPLLGIDETPPALGTLQGQCGSSDGRLVSLVRQMSFSVPLSSPLLARMKSAAPRKSPTRSLYDLISRGRRSTFDVLRRL